MKDREKHLTLKPQSKYWKRVLRWPVDSTYYFPKGGCKDVIEREKRLAFSDGTFVDEKAEEGIIETIADRLITDWNARKDRAEVWPK